MLYKIQRREYEEGNPLCDATEFIVKIIFYFSGCKVSAKPINMIACVWCNH